MEKTAYFPSITIKIEDLLLKWERIIKWKAQTSLPPGRYEYKFIADHHWVEDLPGVELAANAFGT